MNPVRKACDSVGGVTALAKKLGIKPPSVSEWLASGKVPPKRILEVEKATDGVVSRYELDPDIYPLEKSA